MQATWASTWAPGAIVGVWVGDRGWTSVRGSTQRAVGPAVVLGEHTRIGSVTKTMTGTLILQLVDQRKLRLNETIERWFPQLPDVRKITIRDLGSMSSGIASYTTDSATTNRYFTHPTMAWNPNTLIAGGAALPRLFTPGNGFNYSDTNFVMLGRIVELVTHKPLAQVMESMLFKPLGMRDSSYPTNRRLPRPFWDGFTIQGLGDALDAQLRVAESLGMAALTSRCSPRSRRRCGVSRLGWRAGYRRRSCRGGGRGGRAAALRRDRAHGAESSPPAR